MQSKKDKSVNFTENSQEKKNPVVTDCVHRTAEWLGLYGSILSDLRQFPSMR